MFKTRKLYSHQSGAFSETLQFSILHQGNVDANHNKFFAIEVQKNPTTNEFRIFTNYGRLGNEGVYEERVLEGGIYSINQSDVEKEYESILKKKQKGKKIKENGEERIEKYVLVETPSPTIGSSNIRSRMNQISRSVKIEEHIEAINFSKPVKILISQLIEENVHQIKALSSVTFSSSGEISTPLGPLTPEHIAKAKKTLTDLQNLQKNNSLSFDNREARELNNEYLSLIPHPFGRKIQREDMILDDKKLISEFELLDNLSAAVKVQGDNSSKKLIDLGIDIEIVERTKKESLSHWINKTRTHRQLSNWKIGEIYSIKNSRERVTFENTKSKLSNVKDLFHGTRNSNVLSILLNGFIVPPHNAPHVTGRMFGAGLYGADSVTKSINYSTGFWGGRANKYDNAFVFIIQFALGKMYTTRRSLYSGVPSGYNSIFAEKGNDLINNEYIVPNVDQCSMFYLIEFKK